MGDELRKVVGLADLCELESATFAFPTRELAAALVDGAYVRDAESCLEDVGLDTAVRKARTELGDFVDLDVDSFFDSLKKGFSLIYLAPGGQPSVWLYESAFLFVAEGREGLPPLFRTPRQMDVEHHMREAGVLPKSARKEPADSVWDEFSFMSYLYGNVAKALCERREADAAEWSGRVVRFWDEHASRWLPTFMKKTIEEAPLHSFGAEYAVLANVGLLVLDAIRADIESRRVVA